MKAPPNNLMNLLNRPLDLLENKTIMLPPNNPRERAKKQDPNHIKFLQVLGQTLVKERLHNCKQPPQNSIREITKKPPI